MKIKSFKITFEEKKKKNPLTRTLQVDSRSMFEARGALLAEFGRSKVEIIKCVEIDKDGNEIIPEIETKKEGVEIKNEQSDSGSVQD
jgi:hypothetical protein